MVCDITTFLRVDKDFEIEKIKDVVADYFKKNYEIDEIKESISNDNYKNFFLKGKGQNDYEVSVKIQRFSGSYDVRFECKGISYDREKGKYSPEGFCPDGDEPGIIKDLKREFDELV